MYISHEVWVFDPNGSHCWYKKLPGAQEAHSIGNRIGHHIRRQVLYISQEQIGVFDCIPFFPIHCAIKASVHETIQRFPWN